MSTPIRRTTGSCFVALVAVLLWSQWALGVQDAGTPPKTPPNTPPDKPSGDASPDKTYGELMASWRKLLAEMAVLRERYVEADEARQAEIVKEYSALRRAGLEMAPLLRRAAARAYRQAPNKDVDLAEFLLVLAGDDVFGQQFEAADRLLTMLVNTRIDQLKFGSIDAREIFWMIGYVKYVLADWKSAAVYLEKARAARLLDRSAPAVAAYRRVLNETARKKFEAAWKQEIELRAAEAKANDLPRVVLRTTQGDIVLELFENEAPNTVANFVNLIEKQFYDGLEFHRVLRTPDEPFAQGGDPKGDGTGGPGYQIKCECGQKNHRNHFRGSISMARAKERNTGGSQFFLCFAPLPHLNGDYTVFGRVIEGMENMSRLRRGDKIVVAQVKRKRDHEYEPSKL